MGRRYHPTAHPAPAQAPPAPITRPPLRVYHGNTKPGMSEIPPLYDAHDHLIQREAAPQPAEKARAVPIWRRGWAITAEICTVVALGIALYMLRPILSVTSFTGTGTDNAYGVKATVADTGISPIRDVKVQCVTNKVIFDNSFTLAFNNFVSWEEYSVGNLKSGESFTANCTFAWSMWEKSDRGMLILGHGTPGKRSLGVTYQYVNGTPMPTSSGPAILIVGFEDAIHYQNRQLTTVDGSFIVQYKWRLWPFQQTTIIHMIESPGPEEGIRWRVAPASEPVIPDAPAQDRGWKMTGDSNSAQFAVTMKGGSYPLP